MANDKTEIEETKIGGTYDAPMIGDLIDLEHLIPETLKIAECVGQTFCILGWEMINSNMGDYARIAVYDPISQMELIMNTSTYPVLIALKAADAIDLKRYWVKIAEHDVKSFKFVNPD